MDTDRQTDRNTQRQTEKLKTEGPKTKYLLKRYRLLKGCDNWRSNRKRAHYVFYHNKRSTNKEQKYKGEKIQENKTST